MIMINKNFIFQFIKYFIVGCFNFVFTYLIYFLLIKINVNYLISFSISWISGVILTYIINFIWIFKPKKRIDFKLRFLKYFIIYITSFLLNLFLLNFLVEAIKFNPLFVQLFIIPIIVVINFLGIKYLSLNKGKNNI